MNITQNYIPSPSLRRSGELLFGVKWIVAHDTGNPDTSAIANAGYYVRSADVEEASAHAFVDDKGVIEVMPLTEKAWHVRHLRPEDNNRFGGESNDWALGIELCYSPADKFDSLKAYQNYVEYMAMLCVKFQVDPLTNLVGHYQLDPPPRRTDPLNAFSYLGKSWSDFIKDVKTAMIPPEPVPIVPVVPVEVIESEPTPDVVPPTEPFPEEEVVPETPPITQPLIEDTKSMKKIIQFFNSRTVWTIILMLAFNLVSYIHPLVSSGVYDLVNGVLTLVAGYFHINPSQNYSS